MLQAIPLSEAAKLAAMIMSTNPTYECVMNSFTKVD